MKENNFINWDNQDDAFKKIDTEFKLEQGHSMLENPEVKEFEDALVEKYNASVAALNDMKILLREPLVINPEDKQDYTQYQETLEKLESRINHIDEKIKKMDRRNISENIGEVIDLIEKKNKVAQKHERILTEVEKIKERNIPAELKVMNQLITQMEDEIGQMEEILYSRPRTEKF